MVDEDVYNHVEPITFKFPITDQECVATLKNIPTSALPNVYGLIIEDLDIFLFEFDVLCQSNDYTIDSHRLKLFIATLKDVSLRWFVGLGKNVITS